jgi:hypothetical protein
VSNPDKSTTSIKTYVCDKLTLIDTPPIELEDKLPDSVEHFMTETKDSPPNCVLFFHNALRRVSVNNVLFVCFLSYSLTHTTSSTFLDFLTMLPKIGAVHTLLRE